MKQNTTPVDMASEPVMARPMTSYNDVMGYLHSIRISEEVKRSVAQRLMVEVTGKNLSKAFARLDHLSQLQDDWDGYGAEKISYQVVWHAGLAVKIERSVHQYGGRGVLLL